MNKYDQGFLKGSEVGDATAKRALKERDDDMARFQRERLEWCARESELKQALALSTGDTHETCRTLYQGRFTALQSDLARLAAENFAIAEALSVAAYDLGRIRDADWDIDMARVAARAGASKAVRALELRTDAHVAALDARLKAADELADAAGFMPIRHGGIETIRLRDALAAYRARGGGA